MDGWMDRWMHGWSRPNHMPSHLDALQSMSSVNFRRFAGGFHSVAKQASFSIAFRRDFGGFSDDFGRVWEAKIHAEIDFSAIFFRCFSECDLTSIFVGFLEARNLENHCLS